jgi:shikimate dehydrogenase
VSRTLRIALLGRPVAHSRSPELFRGLATHGGPEVDYELRDVDPGELGAALAELAEGRWDGANVTLPYKSRVAQMVDVLDSSARASGSVNVIVRERGGRLRGANTDGAGFVASLERLERQKGAGDSALVLGSGGSAGAVVHALRELGRRVTIVSRDPQRARVAHRPAAVLAERVIGWAGAALREHVRGASLIVQATPLGMSPHERECVALPWDEVTAAHRAIDLVYEPWQTVFLERIRARGARGVNGWPMLVHQAAAALEIWVGTGAGSSVVARARELEPRDPWRAR